MQTNEQPNILVIMSDEHAPQASEVYGHPYVKTPHMKELAETGVVFEQAYSDSPLCAPQRASFMTGLKVHRHGVWDNGVPLPSDIPTFAHMLTNAGYETALSGKMHFVGADQLHGFQARLTPDCNYLGVMAQDSDRMATPIPNGTGIRLHEAGPSDDAVINEFDDQVERQALSFLSKQKEQNEERPFALVTSFIAPHFPLMPRPQFFDMYKDIVTLPEPRPEDASQDMSAIERLRRFFNFGEVDEATILRARAAYYGLITQTDERLGRVLSHLKGLNLKRPTVIVYVSDHGEMMGEHDLWWKSTFYEQSVRIPFIVSCTEPGWFQPRREAMPVTLIDLTRTIIGLSGSDADTSEMDGMDLTPYLKGKVADLDRIITSEYHAHGTGKSMAMVRQGKYKLVYADNESTYLYDLEEDPGEWYNISNKPEMREVCSSLLPYATQGWPADIDGVIKASLKRRKIINEADKRLPDQYEGLWLDVGADRGWEGDNFNTK